MVTALSVRQTIKQTSSLCPVCRAQIPAEVYEHEGKVYLHKRCDEHGAFDVLINSDRRWYFESMGTDGSCCGGGACGPVPGLAEARPGHDPLLIEQASTCIALIELVTSCNLKCPTCYADSPFTAPENIDALTVEEFWARVGSVLDRKGLIDILQLSGGEPTIHPQFLDILETVLLRDDIGYVLLNTNGVRLAQDDVFMNALGELRRTLGKFEVYLQFDGTQTAGQRELRAADLRGVRDAAIIRCGEHGIPVTLAMTVNEHNLPHLGDTLRYALARPTVRGICYQPEFGSGRTPENDPSRYVQVNTVERAGSSSSPASVQRDEQAGAEDGPARVPTRLNVADVIHRVIDQSDGLLTQQDFTPLPCGDPNCHTIGYLIRRGDGVLRVSDFVNFAELQGFLKDRVDFNMEDLAQCGCENEELGQVLKALEIGPDDVLRLFIKPFMDAWTYDQHRIDRCCVHVIGEGGKLESFCRHYAMRG